MLFCYNLVNECLEEYMEFKEKLKELRIKNQLTQEALGEMLHVSRSLIAKWESGLGIPTEGSIDKICEIFI